MASARSPLAAAPAVVLAAVPAGVLVPAVVLAALLIVPAPSPGQPSRPVRAQFVGAAQTYRSPVTPLHVLNGFHPPATRYGAGHLGVDLVASGVVRSAGPGTVTFAGSVAGRGVVVVLHPDGIRTEYEPLRPMVTRGRHVAPGAVLGVVAGTHRGCAGPCLHWGARRGAVYLDPLSLLRPLGPVRLLPWSG